jgi:hypothetical protein
VVFWHCASPSCLRGLLPHHGIQERQLPLRLEPTPARRFKLRYAHKK